jgi:MFS family permease
MNQNIDYLFPCLVILNFLNFSTFAIPATFYPAIAKEKGMPSFVIGLIFSIYPVGTFLSGLLAGEKSSSYNKKKLIMLAEANLAISFIGYNL